MQDTENTDKEIFSFVPMKRPIIRLGTNENHQPSGGHEIYWRRFFPLVVVSQQGKRKTFSVPSVPCG
jgi:hypothetical protein